MEFSLKDIVKDNVVRFSYFRNNELYYTVKYNDQEYIFNVPIEDVGTAKLMHLDKAMLFMRWIRKAIDNGTFVLNS